MFQSFKCCFQRRCEGMLAYVGKVNVGRVLESVGELGNSGKVVRKC